MHAQWVSRAPLLNGQDLGPKLSANQDCLVAMAIEAELMHVICNVSVVDTMADHWQHIKLPSRLAKWQMLPSAWLTKLWLWMQAVFGYTIRVDINSCANAWFM